MNPALLIAGHGTRDAAGVAAFAALTERVARLNARHPQTAETNDAGAQ